MTAPLDLHGAPGPQPAAGDPLRPQRPRWTTAIAVTLGAVYALEVWFGGRLTPTALVELAMGANQGRAVAAGQVDRLLSSAFLHGSPLHLGLNVMALFALAPLFEELVGGVRLSVLYLGSALCGALASAAVHSFGVSVGASGAIFGLMGGAVGLALRPGGLLPPRMAAQMRGRLWLPLLINLAISLQPGIDLSAHLGGGLFGLALVGSGALGAGIAPLGTVRPLRHQRGFIAAAVVLWVLAGASLATSIATGRPWEFRRPVTALTVTRPA